jgi:hypothetical protein
VIKLWGLSITLRLLAVPHHKVVCKGLTLFLFRESKNVVVECLTLRLLAAPHHMVLASFCLLLTA